MRAKAGLIRVLRTIVIMRVRQIEEPDFLYHSDSNMREFYQSI